MVYVHIKAPKPGSEEYWPIVGLYTVLFSIMAGVLLIIGISDGNLSLVLFGILMSVLIVFMIWAAKHDDRKYKQSIAAATATGPKYSNTIIETNDQWDESLEETEFTPVEVLEDDDERID